MGRTFDTIVVTNNNGGLYVKGRWYSHTQKIEVANKFLKMFVEDVKNNVPTVKTVAKSAKVSPFFARKVMNEIKEIGDILDPLIIKITQQANNNSSGVKLNIEERKYLLDLRADRPGRPNYDDYKQRIFKKFGKKICEKTVPDFFCSKREFMFKLSFCVLNKILLHKFADRNMVMIYEFQEIIQQLTNFFVRLNFFDKKHIVNHNCIPKKVRNDPLTGKRPAIFVSGNFCDTFNIFVCISVNPVKKTPIAYHIERNN